MTFAGVTPTQVAQTALFTTGSAADVLVTGMSITPGAGTFLVSFGATGEGSAASTVWAISVYVGGVKIHERRESGTDEHTAGATVRLTVLAGQAVEMRVRKHAGAGTVELRDRNLLVHRVNQ